MKRLIITGGILPVLVLTALVQPPVAAVPTRASAAPVTAFTAAATAMPIRLDINDPNLPVDTELDIAYTHAEAQSGPNAMGRASWLWPGDAVGTGLKQIRDNSGLPIPAELSSNGYPVQVNSAYPASARVKDSQSDETAPGMVMRTSSGERQAVAKAAYSPDGDVPDDEPTTTGDPGGLPGLPGLPALQGAEPAAADDQTSPLGQLAALVDAGSMSSVSDVTYGSSSVVATASSRISDLSMLGGLVTADAIRVTTTTTSTLAGATTTVVSRVSGLAVAGHPFSVGKDGVTAEGQGTGPIPGLPDNAVDALATLGLRFEIPKGTRTVKGSSAAMAIQGLRVTIDTAKLHAYLDQVPIDDVTGQFPPELSVWLGVAAHFAPELVLDLGNASTSTAALKPPTVCLTCGPKPPKAPATGGTPGLPGLPGAAPPPAALPPAAPLPAPGVVAAPVTADLAPVAAGLPPLASIPTLLILLGLLVAGALGWGMRRLGVLALAGTDACTHGLEIGVPDLRKA